mmetsp:Transcript_5121/g.9732  ORF Transcript_5121/g.9732 Transcript_5121/m.9732 type:complete len:83 (+) Transcript_5121:455-703(+)
MLPAVTWSTIINWSHPPGFGDGLLVADVKYGVCMFVMFHPQVVLRGTHKNLFRSISSGCDFCCTVKPSVSNEINTIFDYHEK